MILFRTLAVLLVVVTAHCYNVEASTKLQLETNQFQNSTSGVFGWKQTNNNGCPVIVSRADWKAQPPVKRLPMTTPVPFVILHHTDGPRCTEYESCCAIVRSIQVYHMKDRGWDDIGYSFLVGEDGRVYEGRGWDTIGAHCPWYNHQSIGIAIMGNFNATIPYVSATNVVQALIKCAVERGKLSLDYILYGHRQGRKGTDCPGDALFKEMQSWPHWKPGDHFPPYGTKMPSAVAKQDYVV